MADTALNALKNAAKGDPKRIVLSEGTDPRVIAAAIEARTSGLAQIDLVGDHAFMTDALAKADALDLGITLHDPVASPLSGALTNTLVDLRKHKGMTPERAAELVKNRLNFAALLVATGRADGTVGGAVETTSDTVRAALQIIGKAPEADIVSSFFVMILPEGHPSGRDAMIYSDAGLVVDPSASELAMIAEQSAASCAALLNREPKVALLSFSTKGSANHPHVTKVSSALELLRERCPELAADGELQFDAAFSPEVGDVKAPGSETAGVANVMIFPDLNAGNIGYKITQRVGGAQAIGPILQGLAKPANDLSRGCSADDIVNMIAVTSAQVRANG